MRLGDGIIYETKGLDRNNDTFLLSFVYAFSFFHRPQASLFENVDNNAGVMKDCHSTARAVQTYVIWICQSSAAVNVRRKLDVCMMM